MKIKLFGLHLFINIALLPYHIMIFFTAVMGFGSASGDVPDIEILKASIFLGLLGAFPNLISMIVAILMKKHVKQNIIYTLLFFIIILIAYVLFYYTNLT